MNVTAGNGQNVITWDPVAGAVRYNLYWATHYPVLPTDNKIEDAVSPYTHTGLSNGTQYYYTLDVITNSVNGLYLFQQSPTAYYDNGITPIQSQLVTKVFNFQNLVDLKELMAVEVWLSQIRTPVTFTVLFRPHGYPIWSTVGTKTVNVPGGSPQYRRKVKFPLDLSTISCDTITQKLLNMAGEFQFALVWTGFCRVDRLRVLAALRGEEPTDVCETDNPDDVQLPSDEGLDEFAYEVPLP